MSDNLNEAQYKKRFRKQLLSLFIQKYEGSKAFQEGKPSRIRPQIALKNSFFASDYYDEMDYRKREWINECLQELERMGIVELTWEKFQTNREIAKVYFNLQSLETAYTLAGIIPKDQKIDQLRQILQPLQTHPWAWVRQWYTTVDQALLAKKSAGFDLDDLQSYADLVKVLLYLPKVEGEISKRVLSQILFSNSKYLEQKVEARLVTLLKKGIDIELERDEEYLEWVGIVQNPKTITLSGPLQFKINEKQVDLSVFTGGVGLSGKTVKEMHILSLAGAERVVLIENLTSYHLWLAEREGEHELAIYLGGFPHYYLQLFLKKLARFIDQHDLPLPVYHWGDIDLGGIRIFEYVKRECFPQLCPLWMGRDTLLNYLDQATPLPANYLKKISLLLEQPEYKFWHDVLQLMLEKKVRLEQESITNIVNPFYPKL